MINPVATKNCRHDYFDRPAQPRETCPGNDDDDDNDNDDNDDDGDDDDNNDDDDDDEGPEFKQNLSHIALIKESWVHITLLRISVRGLVHFRVQEQNNHNSTET